jgi:prepilin-type N-terminal cleavage/methylation domain-containing protein
MKIQCSSKGYTLVEIMIVVLIIGVLAVLAVPVLQRVHQKSRRVALLNDARQIGAAAQQYMNEKGATSVTFTFTPSTGVTQDPLSRYVARLSEGYMGGNITISMEGTFSLMHPQVKGGYTGDGNLGDPVFFNAAGQLYAN